MEGERGGRSSGPRRPARRWRGHGAAPRPGSRERRVREQGVVAPDGK